MKESSNHNWRSLPNVRPSKDVLQKRARQLETLSVKHARRFILERVDSIKLVKRYALSWLVAVGLLIVASTVQLINYQRSYSVAAPQAGGTFAEGVVGPVETLNPLFAITSAEQSASRLMFGGLMSYDESGSLRNDLALSWRIENGGKRYIVDIRPNVKWHDEKPVTADDIVFTVGLMKNREVRSPLYGSWANVKVSKLSNMSVAFDLSRVYVAFPHALTFGVVPKHLLSSVPPERLREVDFSQNPVGTGPFEFNRRQIIDADGGRSIVYMSRNENYWRGPAKLSKFQLHVFKDTAHIKDAFLMQEINAATDLSAKQMMDVKSQRPEAVVHNTKTLNGMYAFLKNDSQVFEDKAVRKAFVAGTDRKTIIKAINGYASSLEGPLTEEHLPSMKERPQAAYNKVESEKMLDQAGWKLKDGKRFKDGRPLVVNLASVNSGDYPLITQELKKQWGKLGAEVIVKLVDPGEFQQSVVIPRAYDALVYELELGADPDVYAYWHSSQADPRGLNLSNYKSTIANEALSSAQLKLEMDARLAKYDLFANTWRNDAPAVALYQPRLHYVTSETADTIQVSESVANRTGRYRLVDLWTMQEGRVYASP